MSNEKVKKAIEDAKVLFENTLPLIEFGVEDKKAGHLFVLGNEAVFTTRELLIGPAVSFAASTMGQKGVELSFYQSGIHTGKFWAENTVAAGLATWDEALIDQYCMTCTAFGWGVVTKEHVSFDLDDPKLVLHLRNTPTSTTTLKILEAMQKDDPNLTVDRTRTFDQYFAGFNEGYFKIILEKMGCTEKVLKEVRGRELQCQIQGADHCVIEVSKVS